MTSVSLLASEYASLLSLARKHPDIKDATNTAITLLSATSQESLIRHSSKLLEPFFHACKTKNVKIIPSALTTLQRLVPLNAISPSFLEQIIFNIGEVINLGVEIQLKILQVLSLLLSNCEVHGETLGDALLICFRLQDSKVAVVSSTSAASLRQIIMNIFEKVSVQAESSSLVEKDNKSTIGTFEDDGVHIFTDLCLLSNKDRPTFLKLNALPRTFGLELIESVLSNHQQIFQASHRFHKLIPALLLPMLLRALSEKAYFPLTVRLIRVVYILLRSYSVGLVVELEVFWTFLINVISGKHPALGHKAPLPPWIRILMLEVARSLCDDSKLLLQIHRTYDGHKEAINVVQDLIYSLTHMATDQIRIGKTQSTSSASLFSPNESDTSYVGALTTAAGYAVAGVVNMVSAGSVLSMSSSNMKIQCIDQLDKIEAPANIPTNYIDLLLLQCILAYCNCVSNVGLLELNRLDLHKSATGLQSPSEQIDNPLSPNVDSENMLIGERKSFLQDTWPAILAGITLYISLQLDEELYHELLTSIQHHVIISGQLLQSSPRDAFFGCLVRLALPKSPTSPSPADPTSFSSIVSNQGNESDITQRNLMAMKVMIQAIRQLRDVWGVGWRNALEALQTVSASLKLSKIPKKRSIRRSVSGQSIFLNSEVDDNQAEISELSSGSLNTEIRDIFLSSRKFSELSFRDFIEAMCHLSNESISTSRTPQYFESQSPNSKRRFSAMVPGRLYMPGEDSFYISYLFEVCRQNMKRLVQEDCSLMWTPVTNHLMDILNRTFIDSVSAQQAGDLLEYILSVCLDSLMPNSDRKPSLELQVISTIAQTINNHRDGSPGTITAIKALHHFLQQNGYTLSHRLWQDSFDILDLVASFQKQHEHEVSALDGKVLPRNRPKSLVLHSEVAAASICKLSFQSLNFIVSDLGSVLPPIIVSRCIDTLVLFGSQILDLNISLTAVTLLMSIGDLIKFSGQDTNMVADDIQDTEFKLLLSMFHLCFDSRAEVQNTSIQTLFRYLTTRGNSLPQTMWNRIIEDIVKPLMKLAKTQCRCVSETPFSQEKDQNLVLILDCLTELIETNLIFHLCDKENLIKFWPEFVDTLLDMAGCSVVDLRSSSMICLKTALVSLPSLNLEYCFEEVVWVAWRQAACILDQADDAQNLQPRLTQANIVAFISVLLPILETPFGKELDLFTILDNCVIYPSEDDVFDTDKMSQLQESVIDVLKLTCCSSTPSVLKSLNTYIMLPAFLVSKDVMVLSDLKSHHKSRSYVAFSLACMEFSKKIIVDNRLSENMYKSMALNLIIPSYAFWVNCKYRCPQTNLYGRGRLPMWKIATAQLQDVLSAIAEPASRTLQDDQKLLSELSIIVADSICSILSTDSSRPGSLSLEEFQKDESFDGSWITSISDFILPLCSKCSYASQKIFDSLSSATRLHSRDCTNSKSTVAVGKALSRITFPLLCANLLFETIEISEKLDEFELRPNASRVILERSSFIIRTFQQDVLLRGNFPLPRIREIELIHTLANIARQIQEENTRAYDQLAVCLLKLTTVHTLEHVEQSLESLQLGKKVSTYYMEKGCTLLKAKSLATDCLSRIMERDMI